MNSDTSGVIPILTSGSGHGHQAHEERKKWKLIQWGWTTLSKSATLMITLFIYLFFWRIRFPFLGLGKDDAGFPYLGYWQDDVYGAVAALIVIIAFVFMRLPEALSQAPGDEKAVIRKVLFALIPSYLLPIVFYRYAVVSGVVAPYGVLWFAFLYAAVIIVLVTIQIYLGLRYAERTTEVGSTPPG